MTKEDVIEAISAIKHPAINHTLLDLGIIKGIKGEDDNVVVVFAFPFPDIPIKEMFINLVNQALDPIGIKPGFETVLMTEEEKAKFLRMEAEAWTGGA